MEVQPMRTVSEPGFGFIEKQDKKYQGTQDLCLVLCGTSALGIKMRDEVQERVKVKV